MSHLRRSQSCCFRHLEKPIKTKENKVKHFVYCCFVFICFYWFYPVFLEGESTPPIAFRLPPYGGGRGERPLFLYLPSVKALRVCLSAITGIERAHTCRPRSRNDVILPDVCEHRHLLTAEPYEIAVRILHILHFFQNHLL